MRPILHNIYSTEILSSLDDYSPKNPKYFEIHFTLEIGTEASEGADLFYLTVCSLDWFSDLIAEEQMIFCENYLVVAEYDIKKIRSRIENKLAQLSAENWEELVHKITQFTQWEFDNYYCQKI